MTHRTYCRTLRRAAGGALAAAITSSVHAQAFMQPGTALPVPPPPKTAPDASEKSAAATTTPTETNPVDDFFSRRIPEALAKGRFSANVRARYEYAEQSSFDKVSHAPLISTRIGYTTAPLYGFQAMAEGENVSVIGNERNYNAAGSNKTPDRPVVADPTTTELNQAWLSYSYTNWITARAGRQRIVLDNHRFIGDVGWRMNIQTYDAATFETRPLPDFSFFYGYLWDVHRVYGDVDGLPAASPNRDFDSDSHLFNVSYSGWKYGRFVGYTYLLDLRNRAGAANSSATYGGYFAGAAPIAEKVSVGYRGEFAYQTDYADSPLKYGAEYYNVEVNATIKPVAFGAGYEVLGTDGNGAGTGSVGFKTPLATLHAFNGWADVFVTTPAKGLRDAYGFVHVTLPYDVPVRAVYHSYEADSGGADFGQEFDIIASKKFAKHWTALVKYARYDGKDAPNRFDVHKVWAQVEFNF